VALASQVSRAKQGLVGRGEEGEEKLSTPSMCLVSFLSTWATSFSALMREARTCFDFHHLSHADEGLLLPTPAHIYEEVREGGGVMVWLVIVIYASGWLLYAISLSASTLLCHLFSLLNACIN
jgi:hypothetical protein